MAEHPAPWLEEILRAAGDISSATAATIQRAAEYGYSLPDDGEAWAQWAARHQAKIALAGLATESDPSVITALRAYREAREHADSLSEAATGPDGNHKDILTPEGLAFYLADHAAAAAHEACVGVYRAASERYDGRVSLAWREADIGFLRSNQAELQAADPESFKSILATFGKDSELEVGPAPADGYAQTAPEAPGAAPERDRSAASPGAPAAGETAAAPAEVQIATKWAVLFTERPDSGVRPGGATSLQKRADEPSARREAEHPARVAPAWAWHGQVVSQTVMTSPWQPAPGEPSTAAQLAGLAEAGTERLRQLASSGTLSAEDAISVTDGLRAALGHIGETISSDAVRHALPEAAKHLDVAGARSMGAAHLIRLAEPAMSARRSAARRPVDFPYDVKDGLAARGGTAARPTSGTLHQAAAPFKGAMPR